MDDDITPDGLADLLRVALAAADPVPERVREGARAALTWATIDAELAELTFDSLLDHGGVRGVDVARQLTFEHDDVELELLLADDRDSRWVGQVIGEHVLALKLHWQQRSTEVVLADDGRFTVDLAPRGPIRFAVTIAGGRVVMTDWVTLA